ncbi:MAG: transmembrane anchor protein, partial [Phenylobacterium sp.]|nr:transmembrane anchor protein [Phenylobacterium sp.]
VWSSSGGKVNFDTHADRPGVNYHGYGKGSSQREAGDLVAAFTGSHGWFWRNRTGETVTITLETSGAYSEVKRVV